MNNATPALLALLLVCSLVAIPVAAGPGDGAYQVQPVIENRTTDDSAVQEIPNRLSLVDSENTSHERATYGNDLGALMASHDVELRTDHARYVHLDREFADANTDERRKMVESVRGQIQERIKELKSREKRAVKAHASGSLSTAELLQVLLQNHRDAATLSDALDELEEQANRIPGYSLSADANQTLLEMHRTPVRSHLESAARGQSDDARIVVETSSDGYVLSYLGSDYVREVTRFDNRRVPNHVSQFDDVTDALEYTKEQYPRVYEDSPPVSAAGRGSINLYQIQTTHNQGRLEVFLDGGTGSVYREVQVLRPGRLPTETQTVWSENGLNLTVNETPLDGPVEVTVVDADTGEPVQATVTVDGFEIGTTRADGTLRFVPTAGKYQLTVETDSGSIEVPVPDY
ncbi:carboxypeptidase-like regulatory domain-containing protein [Halosolutus gelatinilyticus]|uniref:carboxypeptidase-like regulatory domain-containing protein n=1 Tax=Halosolutus gelatinilyticus TaxID=2931975 RepID=UPI001FF6A904|nr:carboxypeptidase-like regulatory domain-containing protein [Halosolutus gelatinilyticus]